MKILHELRRTTDFLSKFPGRWAICGGVAASVYRKKPRFTDDIDIALVDSSGLAAEQLASHAIQALGFREYKGFIPDPIDPTRQILGLICARTADDARFVGIDFLLPIQLWIPRAVEFAQSNCIDYGFAALPTVTPESLIVSKVAALCSSPDRYQDLDDINEIMTSIPVDLPFVDGELQRHGLEISAVVKNLLDKHR